MSASARSSLVLLDIVEEYFEQLDFLWELRERHVFAPDWTLRHLADLEERAEAHLDGLRIAGDLALELARLALGGEERGAATAAAMVLLSIGRAELEAEVVAALRSSPAPVRDGIRIALRHTEIGRIAEPLSQIAEQAEPAVRIAAADVLAFRRSAAPKHFEVLMQEEDPEVLALAIAAAGRWGGPWTQAHLEAGLASPVARVRWFALETSAKVGLANLGETCRRAATRAAQAMPEVLEFLGVLGEAQDVSLLAACSRDLKLAPAALAGLGALGRVAAVPVLIEAMSSAERAVTAGAAFVRITGATRIEGEARTPPSETPPEDASEAPPAEKPPDPERVRAYWEKHKERFDRAARWQAGMDVTELHASPGFDALPLRVRRDLYLAARVHGGGDSALELEARAALQVKGTVL